MKDFFKYLLLGITILFTIGGGLCSLFSILISIKLLMANILVLLICGFTIQETLEWIRTPYIQRKFNPFLLCLASIFCVIGLYALTFTGVLK